jgi:hypothetical protein
MVVEMSDGNYCRVRINNKYIAKNLKEKVREQHKEYNFKFSFVPRTYFCNNKIYMFIFELRAYHKRRDGY